MKRWVKILIYTGLFLLTVLLAGYFTRNQWSGYLLRNEIAGRSKGKIKLSYEWIRLDIFKKQLVIYQPSLAYKNVYINKKDAVRLIQSSFQKIAIKNVYFWDLVKHHQIVCDQLHIEKPDFTLKNTDSAKLQKSSSFDPGSLINILENQSISKIGFQFLVKHTQIDFGKIHLVQSPNVHEYGSTTYEVMIDSIGTPLETVSDSLNIVTYKNLEVKVKHLIRYSERDNFEVKIDSASYHSMNKRFLIHGVWFKTLKYKSSPGRSYNLHINWLSLNGLQLKKTTGRSKEIHFETLKLIGGALSIRGKTAFASRQKTSQALPIQKFLKDYGKLSIDTLIGKHINVYRLNTLRDTLFLLKRINFNINHATASKKTLSDPLHYVRFHSFNGSLVQLKIQLRKSGIAFHSGHINYNNSTKTISIEHILARSSCARAKNQAPLFSADKTIITNFSIKQFQKEKKQSLSLELISPDFRINLDSSCARHGKRDIPPVLLPLRLKRIQVKHGNFGLTKKDKQLTIKSINLFVDGLRSGKLLGKNPQFNFDTLYAEAGESYFVADSTHQIIKSGLVKWENEKLSIHTFQYTQDSGKQLKSFTAPAIAFTHLRLNGLLFHNKMMAGGAYFYKPDLQIKGEHALSQNDTAVRHWNRFRNFPIKIYWSYLRINQGWLSLQHIRNKDSLALSTKLDVQLYGFKMGYDKQQLLSEPKKWDAQFEQIRFKKNQYTGSLDRLTTNSQSGNLAANNLLVSKNDSTKQNFHLSIPSVRLQQLNFGSLIHSDSLIFNRMDIKHMRFNFRLPQTVKSTGFNYFGSLKLLYDTLQLSDANFKIGKFNDSTALNITGTNLNLMYHPRFRHPAQQTKIEENLIKRWDLSLLKLVVTDTLKNTQMVADRIALQSQKDRLTIYNFINTNFSANITKRKTNKIYDYLQIYKMRFSNLSVPDKAGTGLSIGRWDIPKLWLNIIHDKQQATHNGAILNLSTLKPYVSIFRKINIKKSIFKDVNVSFQYQNRQKLINIQHFSIHTNNIYLDTVLRPDNSHPLFDNMLIDINRKKIISGDSLYVFRFKDIRINMPLKQISLDSVNIKPRFPRDEFFKRSVYQTDRVSVYGRRIDFNNFEINDLLKNNIFHFGSMQLKSFNTLFERDKRYPPSGKKKPLLTGLFKEVPYPFYVDSLQLLNSQVSYYEFNAKSQQPGIFFIDNFDVDMLNVTNNSPNIDSSLVLKVKATGKIMKQADLNFTLVMPYFAPNHQFWFSAQTGTIDFPQFNIITESTLGISIASGKGKVDIPFVTGNDLYAKGNMYFLYHKLKLRLYSRKKAKTKRGFFSPFVNFMLNDLMIRSNNPKFLTQPRKGIVYFERDPQKSFINYIWKSTMSGMLSTLGFNNKQQRITKREDKVQQKQQKK